MFNSPKKQLGHELEIKINGKKIYQIDSVKYLGIHNDKNLTWKQHINKEAIKLSKSNSILSKIIH